MTNKQSGGLKYIVIGFFPGCVYASILLITLEDISLFFYFIVVIVSGLISQITFKIFLERYED